MNTEIITLREELHRYPELSGVEINTAKRVQDFIQKEYPGEVIEAIGGPSFSIVYQYSTTGNTIGIRCELDALPIEEKNDFEYKSLNKGVSHKCGHDGHMAIVSGLIFWLQKQEFKTGTVVLLFQSAEETGKGAYEVLKHPKFKALKVDYLFALHNIPGVDLHTVITMNKGFSAEVESLIINLEGIESHAAEPENGINPSIAISKIIQQLNTLIISDPLNENFSVLTPVHLKMGEKAYGISPAFGELHYTIRTWNSKNMQILKENIKEIIENISIENKLSFSLTWLEHFPASENDTTCNAIIKETAKSHNFKILERPYPFKFGEDFGWFSKEYKTGMFGLGSGLQTPPLHNPSFDFPNEIISTGIQMFGGIIKTILEE